jgi:cell division protein FtsQ
MIRRGDARRSLPAARPMRSAGTRAGMGRSRGIRRRSAGLTPVRAGALLVLLAGLGGLYGLVGSGTFTARHTTVTGATWTAQDAILAALAIPQSQNVFTVSSAALAGRLAAIPAIRTTRVEIALPDEIRVAVTERQALVVWQAGTRRYLVDESGLLFAELGDTPPAAAAALPVIDDHRAAADALLVGTTIDPVTLDAALRIGSLKPADLGSVATQLAIHVDDVDGFSLTASPAGWTAVFGFYTPTLRTTDLVPGQVRLLRSLLYGREAAVLRIVLADDRSGTYVPRPGASASASASLKP